MFTIRNSKFLQWRRKPPFIGTSSYNFRGQGNDERALIYLLGHSISSEPMKKLSRLGFYSYLVNLKYYGRYEKLQIFIIVYVVLFHL
jgi:hypothetical protein